jgi:hypothetical protein
MKIVDAVWEKRNLGLKVFELTIQEEDIYLNEQIEQFELKSDYVVIKLPIVLNRHLTSLQDLGYQFIEQLTINSHLAVVPKLTPIMNRFLGKLSCQIAKSDEVDLIRHEIDSDLFDTDRVSLDPKFSKQDASNRYLGMISDEIEQNGKIYVIKFNEMVVGFFTLHMSLQNIAYCNLGGIFKNFQNLGFGIFLNYFQICITRDLGGEQTITAYSSNNVGAFAVHQMFDYKVIEQYYVFIKHISKET